MELTRTSTFRTARTVAVRAARGSARAVSRGIARVVDPVPVVGWLAGGARDDDTVRRAVARVDSLGEAEPAAVVANYVRGWTLIGLPGRKDVRFDYLWTDERGLIDVESKHVPGHVRREFRRLGYEIRFDDSFLEIVRACRRETWTWITDDVVEVYGRMFDMGLAASIGVFDGDRLVGGLWGIQIGRTFGPMSTFHRVDHAGAIAHLALCDAIGPDGRWDLVDLGPHAPWKARFGSRPVPASDFVGRVLAGLTGGSGAGDPRHPLLGD